MMRNSFALLAVLALAIAGCQQRADDSNIAIGTGIAGNNAGSQALPPSDAAGAPAGDGFNLTSTRDADTSAGMPIMPKDLAKATIPASMHGRWGMVAADCTSTRGDAKGLIVVTGKTMKFHESLAMLKEQRPAIATSFSGLFSFTGEGQTWQKVMTLTRTGDMLKRADNEGSYTYTRCA